MLYMLYTERYFNPKYKHLYRAKILIQINIHFSRLVLLYVLKVC